MTARDALGRLALPAVATLPRRTAVLGGAAALDYGAQLLLMVVLARALDPAAFGQYRLLWLVAATVMAIAPLAMPASLYYFWPRSAPALRRLYLNHTLLVLFVAGLLAAWAAAPWNPWLPERVREIAAGAAIVPAFVLLWVVASLLDVLPTVDERVTWQAAATIVLALLRTAALAAAALLTRQLWPVLLALLGFALLKVALLLVYVARYHGLRGPLLRRREFGGQIRYAAPFAAAGALYNLRIQADQWVVASFFSLTAFAAFSIAGMFGPLLHVLRQSVNNIYLPSMGRCQVAGDPPGLLALNGRANVMVAAIACPLFVFIFAFAEDLVALVYTVNYLDAVPVMRIYVLGFVALVVELATVTLVLARGRFVMRLNLLALVLCVLLSAWAALRFGASAAAWGGVVLIWFDRLATLHHLARVTGLPWRRLQDWRALGRELLFAATAGACAWLIVEHGLGASTPLRRLALGATLLGLACAAMHACAQINHRSASAPVPRGGAARRRAAGDTDLRA